jgi:hypothetical protein
MVLAFVRYKVMIKICRMAEASIDYDNLFKVSVGIQSLLYERSPTENTQGYIV